MTAFLRFFRRTPHHLRGRKPVECGEGTVSEAQGVRDAGAGSGQGDTGEAEGWLSRFLKDMTTPPRPHVPMSFDEWQAEQAAQMANQPWHERDRAAQMDVRTYDPWQREDGTLTVEAPPLERARRKALMASQAGAKSAKVTLEEWRAMAYEVVAEQRISGEQLNRHNLFYAGVKLEMD